VHDDIIDVIRCSRCVIIPFADLFNQSACPRVKKISKWLALNRTFQGQSVSCHTRRISRKLSSTPFDRNFSQCTSRNAVGNLILLDILVSSPDPQFFFLVDHNQGHF